MPARLDFVQAKSGGGIENSETMPYSMPFAGQKYKWVSLIFMAGLPFFVIWRWMKGDLPYIENPNRKIVKKIFNSSDD